MNISFSSQNFLERVYKGLDQTDFHFNQCDKHSTFTSTCLMPTLHANTGLRIIIKEQAWSLPENFVVRDDEGSAVFEIRGAFVNIDDDLVLIDRSTRQELARAHVKQHIPSLALLYEIHRNGRLWANMHDRFRFFHEDFKIETGDGSTMRVKGDTLRWNFSFVDQTGQPLAHIGRQYSKFPDCYAVEIAQDVDEVAMVALVIVMDIVRERQEEAAS